MLGWYYLLGWLSGRQHEAAGTLSGTQWVGKTMAVGLQVSTAQKEAHWRLKKMLIYFLDFSLLLQLNQVGDLC